MNLSPSPARLAGVVLSFAALGGAETAAQDARPLTRPGAETRPATDTRPASSPASAPARRAGGAAPSDDAFKMGSPAALAPGLTEEDMWPAATAEGWKKPVLVHWQRTFDD